MVQIIVWAVGQLLFGIFNFWCVNLTMTQTKFEWCRLKMKNIIIKMALFKKTSLNLTFLGCIHCFGRHFNRFWQVLKMFRVRHLVAKSYSGRVTKLRTFLPSGSEIWAKIAPCVAPSGTVWFNCYSLPWLRNDWHSGTVKDLSTYNFPIRYKNSKI